MTATTTDKYGRPYLKKGEAHAGMAVWLDDGFECAGPGPVVLQENDGGELWFPCRHGRYFFDERLKDGCFVGVYPSDPEGGLR